MPNVTTILGNETGVQYGGVEDRTSGTGTYPVIGLIVGSFLRGRFDKPMTITSRNIRALLGYDPKNPHYQAVQDVLNSGVPSVQVLRVENGCEPSEIHLNNNISLELDTGTLVGLNLTLKGKYGEISGDVQITYLTEDREQYGDVKYYFNNLLSLLINNFIRNNFHVVFNEIPDINYTVGDGGGEALLQFLGTSHILGGPGEIESAPFTLTVKKSQISEGFDLFSLYNIVASDKWIIHGCGISYFESYLQ